MTCVELQESLIENETGGTSAQRAHLKDCPHCSALVADLLVIACAAGELRAAEDPSPRVWNSIEAALRREGIIKPQRAGRSLLPSFSSSWSWARWALPVAAAILVAIGIAVRPHNGLQPPVADNVPHTATTDAEATMVGLNDNDLLAEIAEQAPALQAQYTDNLRRVNEYIRDAKESLLANPNDEEARRALMDACQEKAMLFELALDRSLP